MLNAPAADQILYKMMTVDNLLRSVMSVRTAEITIF